MDRFTAFYVLVCFNCRSLCYVLSEYWIIFFRKVEDKKIFSEGDVKNKMRVLIFFFRFLIKTRLFFPNILLIVFCEKSVLRTLFSSEIQSYFSPSYTRSNNRDEMCNTVFGNFEIKKIVLQNIFFTRYDHQSIYKMIKN